MSFSFSISDFFTLGALARELGRAYASAPEEYRLLVGDLDVFRGLIEQFQRDVQTRTSPLNNCSAEQKLQLFIILRRVDHVLGGLQSIRDRYQRVQSRARVWDRLIFPSAEVRASQAQLHLHISALKLFLGSLTTAVLGQIMTVLEDRDRLTQANWATLLSLLAQRGIGEEMAAPFRGQLEEHVQAIREVAESERALGEQLNAQTSQSQISEESVISGDVESTLRDETVNFQRRQFAIGPPTARHLKSRICKGAICLQEGKDGGIRQRKSALLEKFPGSAKYKLECQNCCFVGFQGEKPDNLIKPTNTPLFFTARQEPLTATLLEYHLDVHKQHPGKVDGLFYRSIFFWKCHVPSTDETTHDKGRYECPFCPFDIGAGILYRRLQLLQHILTAHVKTQPSEDLRVKFNCWIEDSPALYEEDHGKTIGRDYDLLLPRPYSIAEGLCASAARDRHIAENGPSEDPGQQNSNVPSTSQPPQYSTMY